jgi:hypothetical protein
MRKQSQRLLARSFSWCCSRYLSTDAFSSGFVGSPAYIAFTMSFGTLLSAAKVECHASCGLGSCYSMEASLESGDDLHILLSDGLGLLFDMMDGILHVGAHPVDNLPRWNDQLLSLAPLRFDSCLLRLTKKLIAASARKSHTSRLREDADRVLP